MARIGKGVIRFDATVRSRIVELYSMSYSLASIASSLGIHRNTLTRWIKKHNLQSVLEESERIMMQGTIKRGLKALSEGATASETQKEYIIEGAEGQTVKVTEKIRILAPNEKAIQILAQKYDKTFSKIDLIDTDNAKVSININTSQMSQRELQAISTASPLGVIETTGIEIDNASNVPRADRSELHGSECSELEGSAVSLDPPSADLESK